MALTMEEAEATMAGFLTKIIMGETMEAFLNQTKTSQMGTMEGEEASSTPQIQIRIMGEEALIHFLEEATTMEVQEQALFSTEMKTKIKIVAGIIMEAFSKMEAAITMEEVFSTAITTMVIPLLIVKVITEADILTKGTTTTILGTMEVIFSIRTIMAITVMKRLIKQAMEDFSTVTIIATTTTGVLIRMGEAFLTKAVTVTITEMEIAMEEASLAVAGIATTTTITGMEAFLGTLIATIAIAMGAASLAIKGIIIQETEMEEEAFLAIPITTTIMEV